ncbi:MAG TPA: HlyD family efflux transporter periplasmic adaptor subunit [Epulopiscium sp.]|nr:HlyD family efflux transporter periplasmic adaptor subunit [Candidatus Epulonipiscium sp.]
MKKKVKLASIIIIAILLMGYGVYNYLQPIAIETKTLALSESAVSFVEMGIVKNTDEQYIYPFVSGKIKEIFVQKGELIKTGDVLAQIDSTETKYELERLKKLIRGYEAQLAMAHTENELSQNTLQGNKSNLLGQLQALKAESNTESQAKLEERIIEQSLKTYERGVKDLEKYKELYTLGYISEAEYKNYEELVNTYKTNYDQSLASKDSRSGNFTAMEKAINAQINSIDVALNIDTLESTKAYYQSLIDGSKDSIEELKDQQNNYKVISTIDGVVSEIYIENVNKVNNTEPAFLIQGGEQSQIEVKVSTRDRDAIAIGDAVTVIIDRRSGDIEMNGYIDSISEKAEASISPLGIEERKVLVLIEPESNDYLGAGYDVDIRFIVSDEGKQLIVPNSALFKKDEQDMVLLIKENTVVEAPVEIGYELNGETIIKKGIQEGDQLITDLDAKNLKVGMKAISSNE